MIYLEDDPIYHYATGSDITSQKIIIGKIAELMRDQKSDVVKAMEYSGVPVNPKWSVRQWVSALVDNLPVNQALQKEIANLLIKRDQSQGEQLHGAVEIVVAGIKAIGDVFQGGVQAHNANVEQRISAQQGKDMITSVILKEDAGLEKKSNAGLYIGMGIGVAVIGTLIYLLARKK